VFIGIGLRAFDGLTGRQFTALKVLADLDFKSKLWLAGGIWALVVVFRVVKDGYNGLVAKKNEVDNAFASVDTTLKKRFDLVPNLVATVKQYAQHEADTLTRIAALRSQAAAGPATSAERLALENQLTKALGGLMVAVEGYPQLKANENFLELQGSLNELEEQLSAARRYYNGAVTALNNAIEMFPSSIMASFMKLTRRELFSIDATKR
jgi:LemA protein